MSVSYNPVRDLVTSNKMTLSQHLEKVLNLSCLLSVLQGKLQHRWRRPVYEKGKNWKLERKIQSRTDPEIPALGRKTSSRLWPQIYLWNLITWIIFLAKIILQFLLTSKRSLFLGQKFLESFKRNTCNKQSIHLTFINFWWASGKVLEGIYFFLLIYLDR